MENISNILSAVAGLVAGVIDLFMSIDYIKNYRIIFLMIGLVILLYIVCKSIKIKRYISLINGDDYIRFRDVVLKEYYDEKYWTEVEGKLFPMHTYEGGNCPFNAESLKFDNLDDVGLLNLEKNEKMDYKESKYYKKIKGEYQNLLEPKIIKLLYIIAIVELLLGRIARLFNKSVKLPLIVKYPNRIGFMLDELKFDDKNKLCNFTAWTSTYGDNVYTSHLLEYELAKAFKKYRKYPLDKSDKEKYNKEIEKIKKSLIVRNNIRDCKTKTENILETGCNRASLLSVQLVILFKTRTEGYKTIMIKRSKEVAQQPEHYQIAPSGEFEVCSKSKKTEQAIIKSYFSVTDAIFREYAEELFDNKEAAEGIFSDGVDTIRNHEEVRRVIEMIRKQPKPSASLEFLGSVVDLVYLRHSLSFVLKIDDLDYGETVRFKKNYEFKKDDRMRRTISDVKDIFEKEKVMFETAGMWHLLQPYLKANKII